MKSCFHTAYKQMFPPNALAECGLRDLFCVHIHFHNCHICTVSPEINNIEKCNIQTQIRQSYILLYM